MSARSERARQSTSAAQRLRRIIFFLLRPCWRGDALNASWCLGFPVPLNTFRSRGQSDGLGKPLFKLAGQWGRLGRTFLVIDAPQKCHGHAADTPPNPGGSTALASVPAEWAPKTTPRGPGKHLLSPRVRRTGLQAHLCSKPAGQLSGLSKALFETAGQLSTSAHRRSNLKCACAILICIAICWRYAGESEKQNTKFS